MSVSQRLDGFQRRHRWAAFPIAVVYKYFDDFGPYMAALIAYYAFVSLFPLLLLAATILGVALRGDPQLQMRLINSGLRQIPVVGTQLGDPKGLSAGTRGFVVGVLGALYGGLGVAQAVQYVMNTAWRVPRNSRPNPLKARGRSVLLLALGGVAALGTTLLSSVGTGSRLSGIAILLGSMCINAGAFCVGFRLATTRPVSWRDVAPGAVSAAVAWQLLQSFGVLYVRHAVAHSSATNGVFAIVLGALGFFFLTGNVVVFAAEVNAVRVDRLYPRALLTPFTDNVHLTSGDRKAYTAQAQAERLKGFEDVHVTFDHPPPEH